MIKTVIIIFAAKFDRRDYKRYGIEILKQNGFNVFVWNLIPFMYPKAYKEIKSADLLDWENLIYFQNEDEVVNALKKHKKDTFIYTTVSYSLEVFNIFRAISKYNIPYCVTGLNANLPFHQYASPITKRIFRITPRKAFLFLVRNMPMKYLGLKTANMVTVIGKGCSISRPEVSKNTKRVYTHSNDFDLYLQIRDQKETATKSAVFLDNYLPYHPDSLYSGEVNPVTADNYNASLNKLFDKIEDELGLNVIIAAHPKSNYSDSFNPFNNRKIVKGKTVELVKNSDLVILNFSTSVNFAVLFKKPCFIFTTNELEKTVYKDYINGFSSLFNKVAVNIDSPFEIKAEEMYAIDEEAYKKYKNSYIKIDGSEELAEWQILSNEIKKVTI